MTSIVKSNQARKRIEARCHLIVINFVCEVNGFTSSSLHERIQYAWSWLHNNKDLSQRIGDALQEAFNQADNPNKE